jgi:hypothetical protein
MFEDGELRIEDGELRIENWSTGFDTSRVEQTEVNVEFRI